MTDHNHYQRLSNGLTLLFREVRSSPVVEIQIAARVGSADETPEQAGLAHFHEHMLFKGTEKRGVGDIAGAIEGAGGRVNAFTSFDATVYHATVPSEGLAMASDVLVDMVRHSLFDPDEIGREIEVVQEEIRRSQDSPHSVCGDALFSARYREHRYGQPILGSSESVASFDREKIRAFFSRWYAPDNLVVVAAGDFDTEALGDTLQTAFADATPAGAVRERRREAAQRAPRSVLLRRSFERPVIEMAWPAPALRDADTPYLDLLAYVLGEGESSRLVRHLRERDAVVDRIDAFCYTPRDAGLFGVSIDLEAEKGEAAVAAVAREVERLRCEVVSPDELECARTNFLASEHFERESVSGLARKLGSFELLADDYALESRYLDTIRSAKAEDLLRVAETYLPPEGLCIAAVWPEAATPSLDEKTLADAADAGASTTRGHFRRPQKARSNNPAIHTYTLASGATLHIEPRPGLSVVALRAAALGGLLAEDEANAGLSRFTSAMWTRGTRSRSAATLAREVESIAADLDGFSGRSSLGLSLEVPSVRGEAALDLFAEVLLEPSFDAEELERERRDTLAAIARREDRPGALCFELFCQTLWQRHPYRHAIGGDAESVSRFGRDDLQAFHRRFMTGHNLVIGIAGDVEPDRVAEQLATRLADLDDIPFNYPLPPEEDAPSEVREAEIRKDRAQCHLVIGFQGLRVDDPDRHALEVVSQLLAGQGGRLFLELRDRQGLAYSLSASNVEGIAPGFFAMSIACAPEKLDAAQRGMFAEIERLLDGPPPEDELERARQYLIGNTVIDRQRSAVRAAGLALDGRYGLPLDDGEHYRDAVRAVDANEFLRVARRIIRPNAYTMVVVRP